METERNWGAEPLRRPTLAEGDTLVFSECGRVIRSNESAGGGTCYRSHWLCLVEDRGHFALLVKHGGGEERVKLGFGYRLRPIVQGLARMDTDERYLTMYQMLDIHKNAVRVTEEKWRRAFVNGTLKKKRATGGSRTMAHYRVWIEEVKPPVTV